MTSILQTSNFYLYFLSSKKLNNFIYLSFAVKTPTFIPFHQKQSKTPFVWINRFTVIFRLIFFMDTKKKTIQIYFHLHFIVDIFFLLIISLEHFAFCLLFYVFLLFSPQSHDENFDLAPKLFSIKLFILYDNFHLNIFSFMSFD